MIDTPLYIINNSLSHNVITEIPNKVFNLNKRKIKNLYFNDLNKYDDYRVIEHGQTIYNLNKNGYRSPDFCKNVDILTSGCSFTYGAGVPENYIWPQILSNLSNLKYNNLGFSGNSVGKIIRDIFSYFKEFGHPKYLFCLFPPFERIEIPINQKLIRLNNLKEMKKRDSAAGDIDYIQSVQLFFEPELKIIDKKPYLAESTIPVDMAHFYAAQQILILEQYCNVVGINLKYGFWNPEHNLLMKKIKSINNEYYKNFIDVETNRWRFNLDSEIDEFYENDVFNKNKNEWGKLINCHSNFKDKHFTFNIGSDKVLYGIGSAHWGFHRHIHIAEKFASVLNLNVNYE